MTADGRTSMRSGMVTNQGGDTPQLTGLETARLRTRDLCEGREARRRR